MVYVFCISDFCHLGSRKFCQDTPCHLYSITDAYTFQLLLLYLILFDSNKQSALHHIISSDTCLCQCNVRYILLLDIIQPYKSVLCFLIVIAMYTPNVAYRLVNSSKKPKRNNTIIYILHEEMASPVQMMCESQFPLYQLMLSESIPSRCQSFTQLSMNYVYVNVHYNSGLSRFIAVKMHKVFQKVSDAVSLSLSPKSCLTSSYLKCYELSGICLAPDSSSLSAFEAGCLCSPAWGCYPLSLEIYQ